MRYFTNRLGRCGLALALGAGAIVAGTGGGSNAAAAPPTPGVTATTVTVGSISDISSPMPGSVRGGQDRDRGLLRLHQQPGRGERTQVGARRPGQRLLVGNGGQRGTEHRQERLCHRRGFSLLDGAEQPAIDANKLPMVTQVLTPACTLTPTCTRPSPWSTGESITGPFKWLKSKYPAAVKAVGDDRLQHRRRRSSPPSTIGTSPEPGLQVGVLAGTPATPRPPSCPTSSR